MEKTGADEPAVEGRCIRIQRCTLRVGTDAWPFAKAHAREIAAYWQQAVAERPKLFDGTIFLLQEAALQADAFRGTFVRADFKSFLYWRETGFRDVQLTDTSDEYRAMGHEEYERLKTSLAPETVQRLGPEKHAYFVEDWRSITVVLDSGELRTGRLRARK